MINHWLVAAHIAVLGYWFGTDLVINATYRRACFSDHLPFAERDRLMDHTMDIDQHVRYALILQTVLGSLLATQYAFFPGGSLTMGIVIAIGVCWLTLVEVEHRTRKQPIGKLLSRIDRWWRYTLVVLLVSTAVSLVGGAWPVPDWLRWKLALFAGVISSGLIIRFVLMRHFSVWEEMRHEGDTDARNAIIKQTYVRSTSVLSMLWLFIASIVILAVSKPLLTG